MTNDVLSTDAHKGLSRLSKKRRVTIIDRLVGELEEERSKMARLVVYVCEMEHIEEDAPYFSEGFKNGTLNTCLKILKFINNDCSEFTDDEEKTNDQ